MRSIINRTVAHYPNLKTSLRIAHINKTPYEFIKKSLISAGMLAFMLTILSFFVLDKTNKPLILLLPIFVTLYYLLFKYFFLAIQVQINKRRKDIDKEVLFAGRYFLVKLYAGIPVMNAILSTSKSFGIAAKYFGEIIDDIDLGTPIEEALANAMRYSPSQKFRKLLFIINNSLKLGINVTKPLESVLQEIEDDQIIEIKKFGKKLNTVVIFYLLAAIVVPSLGMTVFIVISSFINLSIGLTEFSLVIFFLILLQLVFMSVFKAIRPVVNL